MGCWQYRAPASRLIWSARFVLVIFLTCALQRLMYPSFIPTLKTVWAPAAAESLTLQHLLSRGFLAFACRRPLTRTHYSVRASQSRVLQTQEEAEPVMPAESKTSLGAPKYSYSKITKQQSVATGGLTNTEVASAWNPLLTDVNGLPRFDQVHPEHLISGMHFTVDKWGKDLERFQISLNKANTQPWKLKWETFAHGMEKLQNRVDIVWSTISLLRDVNDTSSDLHQAYHELIPLLTEIASILGQSEDIYQSLNLVSYDSQLSEPQRRIVEKYMLQAWHSGIGIEEMDTARQFNKNQQELAYLAALFASNVFADEEEVVRLAEQAREVAGLQASILKDAADAARVAGHDLATIETGPWLLLPNQATSSSVLRTSQDRDLRKDMYLAVANRGWKCTAGNTDNTPVKGDNSWIIVRMLKLRLEWARNVGYDTYADMVFANRIATERQVSIFLERLQNASLSAAHDELQELRAFAKERGELSELMAWDIPFWRDQLRTEQLALNVSDVQQYFTLPSVLAGLFQLVKRLFQIDIVAADGEVSRWDKTVRFFRVVDTSTSAPVGGFNLDVYSAPRKRRPGFWVERGLRYSKLLGAYGSPRRPIVHIVGDVTPPTQEGLPALMTFTQVCGLFRAMGHALQELLTEQEEGLAAGTLCMELDAVGFPQHFLEMWAYDRTTLRSIGRHVNTGETMPEEIVNAVVASQSFHGGLPLLEEVRLSRIDLELHARFDPYSGESPLDVAHRIVNETDVGLPHAEDHALCAFLGPFSTGYAAGHYADLWAEVFAADAFEAFEEAGLEDEEAVAQLGRRFRDTVLEPGGGRSPLSAFRDFRGRIPRVSALLRRRGLERSVKPRAASKGF